MTVAGTEARPQVSPLAAQAVALARRSADLAREGGREDLLEDLTKALQARAGARVAIVVCGDRDSGKRAVMNALLDRPSLLPLDDEATTTAPLVVRGVVSGEEERLAVHAVHGDPIELPVDQVAEVWRDAALAERGIRYLDMALRHPLLTTGLVLVDTPGLGGLGRARGLAALAPLANADAALLVVDGGAPIAPLELEFARQAAERVDAVLVALDRHDRQHGWREVARETDAHLSAVPGLSGRSALLPVSARMKLRADRMAGGVEDAGLRRELVQESGIEQLAMRLERLVAERAGALHAARVTRLADALLERLAAREHELRRSADKTTEELRERLISRQTAKENFAHDAPALRRRLNNELRLVQKDADAASVTRLNEVRRSFDKKLAEGFKGDLAEELEAELLSALEQSLADVRTRMEASARDLAGLLSAHGAELVLDDASLDPGAVPHLSMVELPPSAAGRTEWMSRAPYAVGALVLNPVYAVVAVASMLFDRHRVQKRAQREQMSRQLVESVNEARAQLSVAVHHALVNGQAALTEAFEEVVVRRRDEIDEEIAAVKAQVSLSETERTRAAAQAETRLRRLEDLRERVLQTRRGALAALQSGQARAIQEVKPA
jgi:hypothetical protein